MCGRFNVVHHPMMRFLQEITGQNFSVETNLNVAPTEQTPVLVKADSFWDLRYMRWWLIPYWSKEPTTKYATFNAKSETLEKSSAFREPFRRRRCILPVSGYYEWKKTENKKVPYYFTKVDSKDIFLAGIHNQTQFCIITREAESSNSEIHHRQPVIIQKSQINNYFNLNNNAVEFLNNIKPPKLKFFEISTEVNNPAKNDPSIINPVR